ncbi:MAG: tRNA pseudouridine(55) synthase TruB [Candidatus Omnitrophica bacterium]|nr:tRNA pseudouridine(55) synthase TruB [Candidatus Omnitrophota bacterium]
MNGIIVVDKPTGMTSHDVVSRVRRKLSMRRVGHAGTLDPLATGVLVILLGNSTKLFDKFVTFDKAYAATLMLGTQTTTADITGEVIEQKPFEHINQKEIENVLSEFVGDSQQKPPMVSAVKYKGERLYKLARKGIVVDRPARNIRIDVLQMVDCVLPQVKFYLECSKGTYVRTLAEDVGARLGCGACITQIQRTKVGIFTLQDAVKLEELNEGHVRSWSG